MGLTTWPRGEWLGSCPNRSGGEQLIVYLIGLTQRFDMKTGLAEKIMRSRLTMSLPSAPKNQSQRKTSSSGFAPISAYSSGACARVSALGWLACLPHSGQMATGQDCDL